MKNTFKILGIIAMVAVVVFVTSCATGSNIGGASGNHGFFTGNSATKAVTGQEIGSYSVILGLVDSGYAQYAEAVKAAVASGKTVTSVTKWMFVLTKTTAYAK